MTFATVESCLSFYWERSQALQAANGQAPRGELAPDGSMVRVDVQGGRGGVLDGVHATLIDINRAMGALKSTLPLAHDALVANWRDGKSQQEIGDLFGISQQRASSLIGRADSFLRGWLQRDGIVRGAHAEA